MLALIPALIAGLTLVSAQRTSTNITISSLPTFSTCRPAIINWSGGSSPYRVYIYPADWTNTTDWLIELPITTRASTTWNVNLPAGFGIVVNVWDGVNDEYSEPSYIQDSGDSSCINTDGTLQSSYVIVVDYTDLRPGLEGPTSFISVTSVPTSSRVTPSVVSTPQATTSKSQNVPPTSVVPSIAPPPPTVTVVQGNGAGKVDRGAWMLSSFLIGYIVFQAL